MEKKGERANFSQDFIEQKYGKPNGRGHRVIFYTDGQGVSL